MRRALVCVMVAIGLSACDPEGSARNRPYGYLEVHSAFDVRPGDSYSFGGTAIKKGSSGKLEGLIKAPLGAADLYLQRETRSYPICTATIRQNRVITVLVQNGPRGLVCTIKD